MYKTNYKKIFGECYNSLINKSKLPTNFKYKDGKLYSILSKHYKTTNIVDTGISIESSSHSIKNELEKKLKESGVNDIGENILAIILHRFYEDMAKNLIANYKEAKINNGNKILFIDDNLGDILKEKIFNVSEIIEYKTTTDQKENTKVIFYSKEIGKNSIEKLITAESSTNSCKVNRSINGCKEINDSNGGANEDIQLEKIRYIFLDLLIGEELLGFEILKKLKELQDYCPGEYTYEIIIFSRSTNTSDIQKALSLGASLYIPKERVFSIPYRLNQLGFQKPQRKDYSHTFRTLIKLPASKIKKLQEEKISYFENYEGNHEWLEKLPKADLHYHFGGGMDAKITLKLSIITVLQYLIKYFQYGSLDKGFIKDIEFKNFGNRLNNIDQVFKDLLIEIYKYAIEYRQVATELEEQSNKVEKKYNIPLELKNIVSAENFFKLIFQKYKNKLYGIKPFIVTCFFNIFLEFGKYKKNISYGKDIIWEKILEKEILEVIKIDANNLTRIDKIDKFFKEKDDKEFILSKLIQATHGNKFKEAVGGITLSSFLKGCDYTGSDVVQTKLTLKLAIKYLCEKSKNQNIKYISVRMTPINFTRGELHKDEVWEAISEGYQEFIDENENYKLILTIIVALKRHYEDAALEENISFGIEHKIKELEEVKIDENDVLKKMFPAVVGFDLTGLEKTHSPEEFRDKFKIIFSECMPITIHSGEETSADAIWQAAYELNSDRVGHGLSLVNDKKLMNKFKDFNKCIELCPTSNFLTQEGFYFKDKDNKDVKYFSSGSNNSKLYPVQEFIKQNLDFVVCTDDPAVQNTDICDEYLWLSQMTIEKEIKKDKEERREWKWRGITKWQVLKIVRNSFKHCFLPAEIKNSLLTRIDNEIFEILQKEE